MRRVRHRERASSLLRRHPLLQREQRHDQPARVRDGVDARPARRSSARRGRAAPSARPPCPCARSRRAAASARRTIARAGGAGSAASASSSGGTPTQPSSSSLESATCTGAPQRAGVDRRERSEHARDEALHVGRAPPVQAASLLDQRERVACPRLALDRDDVAVRRSRSPPGASGGPSTACRLRASERAPGSIVTARAERLEALGRERDQREVGLAGDGRGTRPAGRAPRATSQPWSPTARAPRRRRSPRGSAR